jgi:hypothetical protein
MHRSASRLCLRCEKEAAAAYKLPLRRNLAAYVEAGEAWTTNNQAGTASDIGGV